jgi:hypothetical protein
MVSRAVLTQVRADATVTAMLECITDFLPGENQKGLAVHQEAEIQKSDNVSNHPKRIKLIRTLCILHFSGAENPGHPERRAFLVDVTGYFPTMRVI